MSTYLKPAVMLLLLMTLLTGAIYPALVTLIAQTAFPKQANGSLIQNNQGQTIGSELIGQNFADAKYFWSRPSATAPFPYHAAASGGSNLGPTNPALLDAVKQRIAVLQDKDPSHQAKVPIDLVTASASGLDPHISIATAEYQIPRVAKARGLGEAEIRQLLKTHTRQRQWRLFGEPTVNVLGLNLDLDSLAAKHHE